jgi:acetyl esterase
MPVHPALQPILDALPQATGDGASQPSAEERLAAVRAGANAFGSLGAGPPEPMHAVDDRFVDGPHGPIPVRAYRPSAIDGRPLVVYYHGGGFVSGSVEAWDTLCRRIAKEADAVVVSVDYRLAPEHRFPIPLNDCHAALAWAVGHATELGADSTRVAVAGDSAGGNLAAAVTLRSRVEGPQLRAQVLVYPVVTPGCDTPSMREVGEGYLLTANAMREMWAWYLGPEGDPDDAFAAVDRAGDYTGLPPALVITAEYDPLRDEGEAYARLLSGSGVDTKLLRYDGMIHGFLGMREIVPEATEAITEIASFLRTHLT